MKITNLEAAISEATDNRTLSISNLAGQCEELDILLGAIPFEDGLMIYSVSTILDPTKEKLSVSGTSNLFGLTSLPVTLRFQETNKMPECSLELSLASLTLQLPDFEWASMEGVMLTVLLNNGSSSTTADITGTLRIASHSLPLRLRLPGYGEVWRFGGNFQPIPLPGFGAVAELFNWLELAERIPPGVKNFGGVAIADIEIGFQPAASRIEWLQVVFGFEDREISTNAALRQMRFGLRVNRPTSADERVWSATFDCVANLGQFEVELGAEFVDEINFHGFVENLDIGRLLRDLLGESAAVMPALAMNDVRINIDTGGTIAFNGSGALDWDALVDTLNIPLPDELRGVVFSQLGLIGNLTSKDFAFSAKLDDPLPFFLGSTSAIQLLRAELVINSSTAGALNTAFTFVLDGKADIAEDVTLAFDQVLLSWDSGAASWSAKGDVQATILGIRVTLTAAIAVTGSARSIELSCPDRVQLLALGVSGGVTVADLSIFSSRDTAAGHDGGRHLGLEGAVAIDLPGILESNGKLSIHTGPEGTRLALSAKAPQVPPIALPLGLPSNPELHLGLDGLTIAYGRDEKGKSEWALSSAARLQIANIPDLLKNYLPQEELSGYFHADSDSVALGLDVPSTLQPAFPELALTFANDVTLSLGQPQIRVMAIALQLGDQPRLLQKLRVTLPRELNHLFGRDAQGHPNLDLFNDEFELHLVMARKPGLVIATSPFKPLTFYEKEGDDGLWTDWNFGPVGQISFRVPEFAYDGGRWKASGGFHRLTDLGLPLTPLKFLLEQSGFPPALTAPIPDAIPLKDVDLTGDNFGREMKLLLGDQVLGRLDKNASALLDELFDAVTSVIDRLPTRLQDYLQIRIPPSAILEISVDATGGGSTLGLRTLPGDPALKFLFPMMLGVPELVGFSLRGLSVGQKLGGTLMQIEIDGHIDRFDMVSLIAALALDRQDFANRYILEKTIFLMPTGLPLPIPLFFSHLGLDYRDILGFDIQAHWSYPDPELGVFESISLFTDLLAFFKNPDYLLHQEGFAETLGLELTIGENFITLPGYLGGQTLGLQSPLPTLSVGDSVARFLDFLKTGNAGYAITAIPLQHEGTWIRIGSQEIKFGPLVIGMSWCITTDEEFVDVLLPASRQHGNLPLSFDEAVLESLPTEGGEDSYQKGFIILLMGNAELGRLAGLRTEFGIAVTAQGGFETGFRMAGEIGRTLSLAISGRIQATEERTTVEGRTGLYWNDQALIAASGRITVSDTALEVEIKIELTPFFYVEGLLVIGKQGLAMEGRAAWGHGADGPDQGIGASVAFTREGMTISFEMRLISFDGQVTVRVPGDGESSLFAATVLIKPDMAMQERFGSDIKSLAKSTAESSVDQVYNDLEKAITEVDSLEISLAGLRKWLPPLCDQIVASITRTINDNTNGWKRPGRATAHKKAKPYIWRLTTLRDVAKKASDRDFRPRLKAALQDIVNHNHLNITVGVPAVRWKKGRWGIRYPSYYTRRVSVYSRDLMDAKQRAQLRQAIRWVDALPDKEGLKIKTQEIYDQLPDRDKLLAQIDREIGQGVDGALPQVESIAFRTSLERLDLSDLQVTVAYRRGGKRLTAKTALDLTNPAKSTQQLIDAFGNG